MSHEAGSQGNALIAYDWVSNSLTVAFGVPASGTAAAAAPHLPAAPSASSPRKAAAGADRLAPGSPAAAAVAEAAEAAVDAQLAALAEPLAEAAAVEAAAAEAAAPAPPRRLGGPLAAPAADEQGRVRLRVLLDGSAVEVFTGSGEGHASWLERRRRCAVLEPHGSPAASPAPCRCSARECTAAAPRQVPAAAPMWCRWAAMLCWKAAAPGRWAAAGCRGGPVPHMCTELSPELLCNCCAVWGAAGGNAV